MSKATVTPIKGFVQPRVYMNMACEQIATAKRIDADPNADFGAADYHRTMAGRYYAAAVQVHELMK